MSSVLTAISGWPSVELGRRFSRSRRAISTSAIQALVDELEFNTAISDLAQMGRAVAPFVDDQFRRAISTGSLSLLNEDLKKRILIAYVEIGAVNQVHAWAAAQDHQSQSLFAWAETQNARAAIVDAHTALMQFLMTE